MVRTAILLVALSATVPAADTALESAQRKIALIEEDRAAPGSHVWLSLEELNAYTRHVTKEAVPQGLRNPRLQLASGAATGYAFVDFLKVRETKGSPPSGLVAWFLRGERPLEASARIQSAHGFATVYVQRVKISGITASSAVLDFLIENFLLPLYPEAKIGKPFALKHNVERLEVGPAGVNVLIGSKLRQR